MQYLHVKNLEKYHPGYTDRNLVWCKIYFSMLNGDAEFQLLEEIDQWRFVKFIMLELQNKKPIPIENSFLESKGISSKNKPIHLTIKMLHNFIEVRNDRARKGVTASTLRPLLSSSLSSSKGVARGISDEEFLAKVKKDYSWVDFDFEMKKMDGWLLANPTRQRTRKFIINWFNKIQKPVAIPSKPKRVDEDPIAKIKQWAKEASHESK